MWIVSCMLLWLLCMGTMYTEVFHNADYRYLWMIFTIIKPVFKIKQLPLQLTNQIRWTIYREPIVQFCLVMPHAALPIWKLKAPPTPFSIILWWCSSVYRGALNCTPIAASVSHGCMPHRRKKFSLDE